MANKLFFCGEVVVDMLEEKQGSGDFKALLGGSHFNAARGAMRAVVREHLDFQVGFVGPISRDLFGDRFFKTLTDEHIDTTGVARVSHNSPLAIVSLRAGGENAFTFYQRETAVEMTKAEELPTKLSTTNDHVICWCGSISTALDPARAAWTSFVDQQRADGALICYDLNVRPSINKDPALYRALISEWTKRVDVMKASDADIAWAYPGMEMKQIAALWLQEGASMAVFTKGKHGAELFTKKAAAHANAASLTTTNTVGAGDNFNAGFAIALAKNNLFTPEALDALEEKELTELLKGANETAARHLLSQGAKMNASA